MGWWTSLFQVRRYGLCRGRFTQTRGFTARRRRRGSGVAWREGKSSGAMHGGLEVHSKVLGG